jgi:hypothetical protein
MDTDKVRELFLLDAAALLCCQRGHATKRCDPPLGVKKAETPILVISPSSTRGAMSLGAMPSKGTGPLRKERQEGGNLEPTRAQALPMWVHFAGKVQER